MTAEEAQLQLQIQLQATEANTMVNAASTRAGESANQRRTQRCGLCRNIGHRRNTRPNITMHSGN